MFEEPPSPLQSFRMSSSSDAFGRMVDKTFPYRITEGLPVNRPESSITGIALVWPHLPSEKRHNLMCTVQKDSFNVNSSARGEPRAKTPVPKPRRFVAGCSPGVPLIEPEAPLNTPLSGLEGPSKLAKFITL